MSEATPPPSAPARTHAYWRWHRSLIYLLSILLMVSMWICGALNSIRQHPKHYVDAVLAQLPFPTSTGKVTWINRRTLEIDHVKFGDFFYADSIVVVASPFGLVRRHVAEVRVVGGQLFTKPLYEMMDHPAAQQSGVVRNWSPASLKDRLSDLGSGVVSGLDWTIARLEISRGTVMLDSPTLDLSVPVRLGAKRPIVLFDLKLNAPESSPAMTRERTEEIENVNIVSPFDPVARVLAFPLIRVRFTYTELWHHQIRAIDLIRPTMFLGEDLFWFTDQFKKERSSLPMQGVTAPWEVGHLEVQYGRLAVNAFGQPVVNFPFFFDTEVDNIRLDQLDKISARSTIKIRRLDQDYPDYKVRLLGLTGQLYFSLPPTDEKANNVVNTIAIDAFYWNEIPVLKVNSTVTFDPNGIYGKINGACEGGQLAGNFEFYYSKGFTWNVDLFADKVNCQPVAEKVAGKYFNLTGELDGKISIQGHATEIQNCQALFTLPHPGLLEIKSIDSLLSKMPGKVTLLKDQVTKIAAKTLSSYPYVSGRLKIDYKPDSGIGTLRLDSPNGLRQFDVYWHPYPSSEVAKANDNQ
jgi:hypothetical protein